MSLTFRPRMDELIKRVRTYRVTTGLAERLRLADAICRGVAPHIGPSVAGRARPSDIEDIVQNSLISIVDSLENFRGSTENEFLAWCRSIAYKRVSDFYRKNKSDKLEFWNPEAFRDLVDASDPDTAAIREELEYGLALLDKSKPECRHYLWERFANRVKLVQIAAELDITPDAARMRVERCLEEVRTIMGYRGPDDDSV